MAHRKCRGFLFVVVIAFTFSTLIHCRSLLHLTEATDDEVKSISDQFMSDHGEHYEQVADFEFLGDDAFSDLQESVIKGKLVSSSEEAWHAMSPKLRCGDDLIKLQLNGPNVAQVELCRGNAAPVSLAHLPSHCGRTTLTHGGLVYATPYDGCGVAQQEGNYVMQMLWQGNPAVLSCPMASSTIPGPQPPGYLLPHPQADYIPPESPVKSPSDDAAAPSTLTQKLQNLVYPPMYWNSYYPHYHYPGRVYPTEYPAAATTTTIPTTTPPTVHEQTIKPPLPGYPNWFWSHYYPYYHYPGKPKPTEKPAPVSVPTTTTIVVAQEPTLKPQIPGYPQWFWPRYPYYYYSGKPKPTEKPAPISAPTTAVAQQPTLKPHIPGYPQWFWPHYYPHYHYSGKPKPTEKPAPTSVPAATTLTAVAQEPTLKPQIPGYPQWFWPHYPHYYYFGMLKPAPTTVPTTTATTVVAQEPTLKPQIPGYPQWFWPHYPHYYYSGMPKPTEKPAPTSVPTTTTTTVAQEPTLKPQLPGYPQWFWPHYYPSYHVQPPKPQIPTVPPITTTPQPCTTTAAAECQPSTNPPPVEPPKYSVLYEKGPFPLQFEWDNDFQFSPFKL